jgi:hypothetical protein
MEVELDVDLDLEEEDCDDVPEISREADISRLVAEVRRKLMSKESSIKCIYYNSRFNNKKFFYLQ